MRLPARQPPPWRALPCCWPRVRAFPLRRLQSSAVWTPHRSSCSAGRSRCPMCSSRRSRLPPPMPVSARIGSMSTPHTLQTVPESMLAYNGSTIVAPYGDRDSSGAFIYRHTDGRWYDHPVGQAQYVVNMLRNHRLDPRQEYLDLAVANADRLLKRAVRHQGAIFFPYGFDFALHGRGTMKAPWYSGMAQGVALSGFVRLWELTGEQKWRDAADQTYRSFLVSRQAGAPWVDGRRQRAAVVRGVPVDTVRPHVQRPQLRDLRPVRLLADHRQPRRRAAHPGRDHDQRPSVGHGSGPGRDQPLLHRPELPGSQGADVELSPHPHRTVRPAAPLHGQRDLRPPGRCLHRR